MAPFLVWMGKQECIVSAEPTVYCTVVYHPPPTTTTICEYCEYF